MADRASVVTFVACDMVVEEARSGKKTIVGIFQNFNMGRLPSIYGRPWFLFAQIHGLDPGTTDITVNIVHDETTGVVFAASVEVPDGHPENADIVLEATQTQFTKPGKHVVSLNINGQQYASFVLTVTLQPQPQRG